MVVILLTCGKHFHQLIISRRGEVWATWVRLVWFVGVYYQLEVFYQHKIPKRNKQVSCCQFSNRHKWNIFDDKLYISFYFWLRMLFLTFLWHVDTIQTKVVTGSVISSRNFPTQKIIVAEWLFSPTCSFIRMRHVQTSYWGFLRKTKRS